MEAKISGIKRILIADPYAAVRQMTKMALAPQGAYEVIAEAGDGDSALSLCGEFEPDILIIDLTLTHLPALEVLRVLKENQPQVRILIFSGIKCHDVVLEALRMQPHGFVLKEDTLAVFHEALRAVASGYVFFTSYAACLMEELRQGSRRHCLAPREQIVLQMIAEGNSSKEIAACLGVTLKTVEHYRTQLMDKLGLRDVARLTRYAVSKGLVPT